MYILVTVYYRTKAEYLLTKTIITKDRTSTLDYLSEVDILSRLPPHPNIVRYIGSSHLRHPQGSVEFVILTDDCGSIRLDEMLLEGKLTETNLKIKCFEDICLAIKHCHDNSVAHLKIIPRNILVDAFGTFKLSNFSYAVTISTGPTNNMQYPPHLSYFQEKEASYPSHRISFTNTMSHNNRHNNELYIYDPHDNKDELFGNETKNVFDPNYNTSSNDSKSNKKSSKTTTNKAKDSKTKNNSNKNDKKSKHSKNKQNNTNKNDSNKKNKQTNDKKKKKSKAKLLFGLGKSKSNQHNIEIGFVPNEESKENSSVRDELSHSDKQQQKK